MTEQTCGTCRYWTPDDTWYGAFDMEFEAVPGDVDDEFKWAEGERIGALYRVCKRILMPKTDWATRDTEPVAYVMDGSGYKAGLHTRESFGCALHERETEAAG
jgi:hypothetical protein